MTEENHHHQTVADKGFPWLGAGLGVLALVGFIYYQGLRADKSPQGPEGAAYLEGEGILVEWGNLGRRLIEAGVIDKDKFLNLYARRGTLSDADRALIDGISEGELKANQANANLLLNLFWALGLGNESPILEKGEMAQYGDTGNFASTGGWSLSKGDAMNHYSAHSFVALDSAEQALVEKVSKGIYRPCCDNSTHFPDCNHGMAMLGLLQLLAAQGATEDQMFAVALRMNMLWFPDQYRVIARYFETQGQDFSRVSPQVVLGKEYSSGSGYRRTASLIPPDAERRSGASCGV